MTVGELQNALKKAVDINVHNSDMEVVFVDELGERKKISGSCRNGAAPTAWIRIILNLTVWKQNPVSV